MTPPRPEGHGGHAGRGRGGAAAGRRGGILAYTIWGPRQLAPGRAPGPAATAEPAATTAPPRAPPTGPVQVKLRLSGADALAGELVPALAAAFLSSQKATDVEVVKAESDGPGAGDPRRHRGGRGAQTGGTAKGLAEAAGGERRHRRRDAPGRADERQKLAVLGAMTSPANEHVVGAGRHRRHRQQGELGRSAEPGAAGAAAGRRASDWSQFGVAGEEEWSAVGVAGKGGPVASGVHVYLPDDRSGICRGGPGRGAVGNKPWAKDADRLATYQAVADKVSADPGGVGVVPMPAVAGARPVAIADLDDPPLMPTRSRSRPRTTC